MKRTLAEKQLNVSTEIFKNTILSENVRHNGFYLGVDVADVVRASVFVWVAPAWVRTL